jgi:FtsP/CotA-like multicopper oxidase with cupredoxin domain
MDRPRDRRAGVDGAADGPHRFELSRRDFLGLSAAAVAGLTAGAFVLPGAEVAEARPAETFVEPAVRRSRNGLLETTMEARVAPVQVAGQPVSAVVYEGMYPGPTLRVRGGDVMKVKLVNRLDDITNLHVHGLHVSPAGNSDNVLLHVMPGETFDFEYRIPANHSPGLYWYHPHFHGDSEVQVFGGLAGAIVIEGDLDDLPGVAGIQERLLVIQSIQFSPDGTVAPGSQWKNDTFLRLVNGQQNPTIGIRPGETQRWRIANVSADNFFRLQLDGHQLHQISADGNTMAEVWTRDEVLLGPGERAEVLVQGGAPGTYQLWSRPYNEGTWTEPDVVLATLVSGGIAETPRPLPTTLIPFEDLRNAQVDVRRETAFQITPDSQFLVDGLPFDENRVNQTVQLGATEEWLIKNESDEWHPFHIHVNDFQVVAINGEPVAAHSHEDTVPIPPRGSITMRTRFLDFPGKFVYHCHILGHEDAGMMAIVEVVDPNAPPTTGQATSQARFVDAAGNYAYTCPLPPAGDAA